MTKAVIIIENTNFVCAFTLYSFLSVLIMKVSEFRFDCLDNRNRTQVFKLLYLNES